MSVSRCLWFLGLLLGAWLVPGPARAEEIEVPEVTLIDQHGEPQPLRRLLAEQRPIALNFIFTSCQTICPVMSSALRNLREEARAAARDVRFLSITIDPEFDRPEVLARYASRFQADRDWLFLTGRAQEIEAIQRAFSAYASDKTAHRPLIFVRQAGTHEWRRFEGVGGDGEVLRALLTVR